MNFRKIFTNGFLPDNKEDAEVKKSEKVKHILETLGKTENYMYEFNDSNVSSFREQNSSWHLCVLLCNLLGLWNLSVQLLINTLNKENRLNMYKTIYLINIPLYMEVKYQR